MIEAAVKQISQMAPPALPAVDLPKVPDLETVPALAEIAHGDPSKLLDAANVLKKRPHHHRKRGIPGATTD